MKRNTPALIFSIFLALGVALLIIAGVITYKVKSFIDSAVETNGNVVDLLPARSNKSTTYAPVVIYDDQYGVDHRYISNVSSSPPAYDIGEIVVIYYNPKNPDDAMIGGWQGYLGAIICGGIGLIFTLLGSIFLLARKFSNARNTHLKQTGLLVAAKFISVDMNRHVTVNRRHPFIIRCEWKDTLTGETYAFKSGFIWTDPGPVIDTNRKIDVYIDRNNPRKYYVDLAPFESV